MQSGKKGDQYLADSELESTSNHQTQDMNCTFALRGMLFITILSFAALLLLSSAMAQQSTGQDYPGKYSRGYQSHRLGLSAVKSSRSRHELILPKLQVMQIFSNHSPPSLRFYYLITRIYNSTRY